MLDDFDYWQHKQLLKVFKQRKRISVMILSSSTIILLIALSFQAPIKKLQFGKMFGLNFYIWSAFGIVLMAFFYLVWRCPNCRFHLGKLDTKVCSKCGLNFNESSIFRNQNDQIVNLDIIKKYNELLLKVEKLKKSRKKVFIILVIFIFSTIIILQHFISMKIPWWCNLIVCIISLAFALEAESYIYKGRRADTMKCPNCKKDLDIYDDKMQINFCRNCGVKFYYEEELDQAK